MVVDAKQNRAFRVVECKTLALVSLWHLWEIYRHVRQGVQGGKRVVFLRPRSESRTLLARTEIGLKLLVSHYIIYCEKLTRYPL